MVKIKELIPYLLGYFTETDRSKLCNHLMTSLAKPLMSEDRFDLLSKNQKQLLQCYEYTSRLVLAKKNCCEFAAT